MKKTQVWLIGGTSESAELAKALSAAAIPYIVTVTTLTARELYPQQASVRVGKMAPEIMADFVVRQNVRCILDASHPFAQEISQQAIAHTSQKQAIAYLRYERPIVSSAITATGDAAVQSQDQVTIQGQVTMVDSIEMLLASDLLQQQRILFTLGYRCLPAFSPLRQTSQLFARVLPSAAAIAGAIAAGFSSQEIIALRPPISLALEKALWQQWNISTVVAKASGHPGGEAIKRQAAAQLGILLILLQRPPLTYPKQTHCVSQAINFCAKALRVY